MDMSRDHTVLVWCILRIICEHLHELYTLNSLSDWKELTKFIPQGLFKLRSIHILCSVGILQYIYYQDLAGVPGLLVHQHVEKEQDQG